MQEVDTTAWRENESVISSQLLAVGNPWTRKNEGNDSRFVKLDKDGKQVTPNGDDYCTFFTDTDTCLQKIGLCIQSNKKGSDTSCNELFNLDLDFSPSTVSLRERVQKIDPEIAYLILKRLKFKSYVDVSQEPVNGFRRFKVQSLNDWLDELLQNERDDDGCKPVQNGLNCEPLKQRLGQLGDVLVQMFKDPAKRNFFTYLSILVNWVNANPQVLNKEEIKPMAPTYNYPPVNDSFKLYSYSDPRYGAQLRVRGTACGLERLKADILNGLSGMNAQTTASNIFATPDLAMPFGRQAFANVNNLYSLVGQIGGAYNPFDQMNTQPGYTLLSDIYKDLVNTMGNLGSTQMQLTPNSQATINSKLENFKALEIELRESLADLIQKNKLYQASRGRVNPFVDNRADYIAIRDKHSNLLGLSKDYNKRSVDMINILISISNAMLANTNPNSAFANGYGAVNNGYGAANIRVSNGYGAAQPTSNLVNLSDDYRRDLKKNFYDNL